MKTFKLVLPFTLIPLLILPYSYLDTTVFVDVFGHEPNTFNANSVREIVFAILAGIATLSGVFITRKFSKVSSRLIYVAAVLILNIIFWRYIVILFAWK